MANNRTRRWLSGAALCTLVALALGISCGVREEPLPPLQPGVHGTGGAGGGSLTVSSSSTGAGGSDGVCTPPCDAATLVCSHHVCVLLEPCTTDDDCENDTTCVPAKGCVPWSEQTPAHDPGCMNAGEIDGGARDGGTLDGGDGGALAAGDCTAGPSTDFACSLSGVGLVAPVCNRGAAPLGPGISVGFYDGGTKVCGTTTSKELAPEECETVTCTWTKPPKLPGLAVNLDVFANDDGAHEECKTGNDHAIVFQVYCELTG